MAKKKVVIIGGGSGGLATAQKLSQEDLYNITVIERKPRNGKKGNSGPCTWESTIENFVWDHNLYSRIHQARKEDRYQFDDPEQFPHFQLTIEGPKRLEKILNNNLDPVTWFRQGATQAPQKEFAFIVEDVEARFPTTLQKVDIEFILRVLATGIENDIHYSTEYISMDTDRKTITFVQDGSQHTIEYDIVIDASGSQMATADRSQIIAAQDCTEMLIRTANPIDPEYRFLSFFGVDKTINKNLLDLIDTACKWWYYVDERTWRGGKNDIINWMHREVPGLSFEEKLRRKLIDIGIESEHDPTYRKLLPDFSYEDILDLTFNTIPVRLKNREVVFSEGFLVGDRAAQATKLCSEGIRSSLYAGLACAEAIINNADLEAGQNEYRQSMASYDDGGLFFELLNLVAFDLMDDRAWKKYAQRINKLKKINPWFATKVMNAALANKSGDIGALLGLAAITPKREILRSSLEAITRPKTRVYEMGKVRTDFYFEHKAEIENVIERFPQHYR